eukprot:15127439-Heterocapsa_arctica.AAC.1
MMCLRACAAVCDIVLVQVADRSELGYLCRESYRGPCLRVNTHAEASGRTSVTRCGSVQLAAARKDIYSVCGSA